MQERHTWKPMVNPPTSRVLRGHKFQTFCLNFRNAHAASSRSSRGRACLYGRRPGALDDPASAPARPSAAPERDANSARSHSPPPPPPPPPRSCESGGRPIRRLPDRGLHDRAPRRPLPTRTATPVTRPGRGRPSPAQDAEGEGLLTLARRAVPPLSTRMSTGSRSPEPAVRDVCPARRGADRVRAGRVLSAICRGPQLDRCPVLWTRRRSQCYARMLTGCRPGPGWPPATRPMLVPKVSKILETFSSNDRAISVQPEPLVLLGHPADDQG